MSSGSLDRKLAITSTGQVVGAGAETLAVFGEKLDLGAVTLLGGGPNVSVDEVLRCLAQLKPSRRQAIMVPKRGSLCASVVMMPLSCPSMRAPLTS